MSIIIVMQEAIAAAIISIIVRHPHPHPNIASSRRLYISIPKTKISMADNIPRAMFIPTFFAKVVVYVKISICFFPIAKYVIANDIFL